MRARVATAARNPAFTRNRKIVRPTEGATLPARLRADGAKYDRLSAAVKANVGRKEFAWMSDRERQDFELNLTSPEVAE